MGTSGAIPPPPPVDDDESGFLEFLNTAGIADATPSSPTNGMTPPTGGSDEAALAAAANAPHYDDVSNGPNASSVQRRVSFKDHVSRASGDAPDKRRNSLADSVASEDNMSKDDNVSNDTSNVSRRHSESSASSKRRGSDMSMHGVWSKLLTRKSEVWDDGISDMDDSDDDTAPSCWHAFKHSANQTSRWFRATMKTAFSSKQVAAPCLLLFLVLAAVGCLIVWGFDTAATNSRKNEAIAIAEQTDLFFVRTLEKAFVPLFTIAQFVHEVELFHEFDLAVGDRCDPNTTDCGDSASAPVMTGMEQTHRNLTGLFQTEYGNSTLSKFDSIAKGIKENSGLGKSLVAIQLAPKAVVSLIYPLVNCEDFDDGYCMNNTGAWGHDLLNDPSRTAIASKTVPADGVVTAGPLKLIQGEDTFIARLPINMDKEEGHSMVVDGVEYPCWGFAVVSLHRTW